ncbi:ABC transporter permease [Bowmanella dokdonensis]|uniref:ABC transporter permease n=1 Tax=Bowmanella dokdonensis TaxID=751969 RepID=A0A939DJS7_9ALTE|nr:ABC transporter permease [Bowmanella dokdonensis]MBN7823942.1 ABC transporter permease [Bowmanella dokdonensis]
MQHHSSHSTLDRSLAGECLAMARMSLANIWLSKWSSVCIIGCIVLMVAVQATFLSMAEGFQSSMDSAGSDSIAVLVDKQSQSESSSQVSREQVELLRHAKVLGSNQLFSPEFRMSVSVLGREDNRKMNVALRGLTPAGFALREGYKIVQGRAPQAGRFELIVGDSLARRVKDTTLGSRLNLGGQDWTIVGHFQLQNAVFETEFWADLAMVQAGYKRENQYQSIRIGHLDASGLAQLRQFVQADSRLALDVLTEQELFREQIKDTTNVILYLGWPLAAILGIGALVGILNIMFISLEARFNSLRIIGLLGFSVTSIRFGIIFETVLLSCIGALLGIGVITLLLDGAAAWSVTGGIDSEVYNIKVGVSTLGQTLGFSLFLGLLGGLLPAWKGLNKESNHV